MDEKTSFLRAILAEPDEDLRRLAFADWLDERGVERMACPVCSEYLDDLENPWRGQPGHRPERDPASGRHEGGWTNCKLCNSGGPNYQSPGFVLDTFARDRAELIRVQCELAKPYRCEGTTHSSRCYWCTNTMEVEDSRSVGPEFKECGRRCHLRWRQKNLLALLGKTLTREVMPVGPEYKYAAPYPVDQREHPGEPDPGWEDRSGTGVGRTAVRFRRGFVEEVRIWYAGWIRHCDHLLSVCPLKKVVLTTVPTWEFNECGAALDGRTRRDQLRGGDHDARSIAHRLLKGEWNKIEFKLPGET